MSRRPTGRPRLPRRGFLAVAAGAVLAGCGFELRKAPTFAFQSIAVTGNSPFSNYLRRQLRAAGTVEVLPVDQADKADAVLELLGESRNNVVLSTTPEGQVRELQLILTLRFRVRGQGGKELLGPTEIQQSRDITYNETAALAKEGESELLYRDMQNDIAQQVLRRLAAIKAF
ncbi:LPS-assembly lipoprotein LptE [Variovorax saccharolyticus]|uniref:LPS-assembly lipoprotein LptE n=1 Tax=Variovorax saccharolyticus TaxID=3053516 RepID=UPI0025773188|nr:LPS assembly lipoprotein LptE [Variovorax sp. J31P216]MDM0027944.1 LPS assembly lipoprotein LptE [Variovorax sp. J31P216]